jgi:hypothetical protein
MPFNTPSLRGQNNEGKVRRWKHQPLTIEHFGIHAKIQENGRILITGAAKPVPGSDDYEYDEVEVSASFIFKLTDALKMTRTAIYVSVSEAATMPEEN